MWKTIIAIFFRIGLAILELQDYLFWRQPRTSGNEKAKEFIYQYAFEMYSS